ncbi:MAG: substrate-binding domain-containing protein [Spirochaetales bacterium]|nr:substrate-binding domain-containing protein [Spirochaetales bacterium]
MKKEYPTIGFFGPRLDAQYQIILWKGITEKAKEEGVNLIYFPGEKIDSDEAFESQANIVYKLAGKDNIDGLIVLSNIIGVYLKKNEMKEFCASFSPIPVVAVGNSYEGIPGIEVDNSIGIRQLVSHLVLDHDYRKFAFVCGPKKQNEVELRIRALRTALREFGLELDDEFIVAGDFVHESGVKAVDVLLKKGGGDFDVILAANDYMAIGALEALRCAGINVPDDMAVTGFDDIQSSSYCNPPLTTVYQPILEKGRKAMETMLDLLAHKPVGERTVLPTRLIVRESCGCFHRDKKVPSIININASNKKPLHTNFGIFREKVIKECREGGGYSYTLNKKDNLDKWIIQLVDAFYTDVKTNNTEHFISRLNRILRVFISSDHDVLSWHRVVSLIRDTIITYRLNREELLMVEYLLEQARELIAEISQRFQGYKLMESERLSGRLWEVGNALITSFNIENLIHVITESMRKLGIDRCYFSVYDKEKDFPYYAYLLLAYDRGKLKKLPQRGIRFKSDCLAPSLEIVKGTSNPFILEPLFFRNEQLGFIIFEMSVPETTIYDALRQQLSSALKGAFLMQETKNYAQNLEREVTARTSELIKANRQLQKEIARRKKVDAALKESETNLRVITSATPIPLVIFRMSDGRLLYSNKPFTVEFGLKDKSLSRKKIRQFFSDPQYIEELLGNLRSAKTLSHIELTAKHDSGSSFSVIASFQTLAFRGEEGVLAGFYNITERKRLEKEILEISGKEQRRIGQDLHDDLCQNMAGIAVMVSALENNLKKTDSANAEKAAVISQLINETIIRTRSLARGLYPAALEENGLPYMLEELSKKIEGQFDISCSLHIINKIPVEDNSTALHLYRITQEAVNNAIRHGEPDLIEIDFRAQADEISLVVRDNGSGISKNYKLSKGMGLRIMNYRANMIGGKLDIRRNGKRGTCLSCTIRR